MRWTVALATLLAFAFAFAFTFTLFFSLTHTLKEEAKMLVPSLIALGLTLLSSTTAAVVPGLPVLDDGNEILNRGLDPNIFHRLGQYAPRYTVDNTTAGQLAAIPPPGCLVEQVTSLERHGARHFTSNALKAANTTLTKVKAAAQQAGTSLAPELQFLRNATLLTQTDSLVPYGALQAWYSGRSTAARYPALGGSAPFVRSTGDAADLDDRVILTAKYWRLGYTGGAFPAGDLRTSDDVRAASTSLPDPNVVFSERDGINNTLDVSTCPGDEARTSAEGESGHQQAYAKAALVPTVGVRLAQRFGTAQINLTATDLINLSNLCSFDTLARAAVVSGGKLQLNQSSFCGVFQAAEWEKIGYVYDVGKYYGAGYGDDRYYKALGQGFLRELISRLTEQAPPPHLQDAPTSLNSTLDGSNATFPVKGYRVFFDGSHDNNIGPIAAAAGLFNGPTLGTGADAATQPHAWVFSHIAPLQGKLVFERLGCGTAKYVRIRANGQVLPPDDSWCPAAANSTGHPLARKGNLCPLDDFVANLAFVETDTEWNKCYS